MSAAKGLETILVLTFLAIARMPGQQAPLTNFPEQKPKADSSQAGQPAAATPENGAREDEGEEDKGFQKKRDLWFLQQRSFPLDRLPAGARSQALAQHQALKAQQARAHTLMAVPTASGARPDDSFTSLSWTYDGPSQVLGGAGAVLYSGRATSLAINPSNAQIMYLGTAAGGVWKTTNGGTTWAPITDAQASLAIGAILIDPNNPNNIFVGTGEADYSGDSYYGEGLLISNNAGATWTQVSTPFVSGVSASPFAQLAIQPGNSSVLLAATESGVYRSTNAGVSWTLIMSGYASSVIFDPVNSNTAYLGMNGYFNSIVYGGDTAAVYKSTNGGATWTAMSSGLPAYNLVYRTALTMDSSGNLLAGIAPSSAGSGTIYKSANGGTSWTALTATGDGVDWYRDWVAAVPGSPNILYTGGVSLYQSMDGGATWTRSSESYATLLWADQHAAVFSPDGTKMYLMDDGGLFMTSSPATANPAFVSLNNGIGSMTFYPGFAITGTTSANTLVGAQDHGTVLGSAGTTPWGYAGGGDICGDGGPMVTDAVRAYVYAHCQGSPLSSWMSSSTGGAALGQGYPYGWVSAQSGIATGDRTAWVPPIATDPSNVANVYTGTYRVYQSTNRAASWTAISGDLTAGSSTLNTIAVSPTNPNVIYTGAGDGTVYVTSNALSGTSATWTKLTGLPSRSISKIVVMVDSPQDIYAVVSGFGSGHLFHSTNGGTTWADLSGNLPNTPVDSVAVDPSVLNTIYLATDTGVYVTSNAGASGGTTWEVLGSNLPNVVVQDIQMVAASRLLRVVTHGRGAWDLIVPANGFIASTNILAFGSQNVGAPSSAQTVTLSNNFVTAVSIGSVVPSTNYTESNTCGTSLASGSTCAINVTFTPTAMGQQNGTVTVTSSQGTITLTLTGTGVAPIVTLSTASLSFASQNVGVASAAQTLTVQNTGTAALSGIAVSVAGSNSADFAQTTTCGVTLATSSSCSIAVTFTPGAVGARAATLSLTDNATGSPQTVSLAGTGVAPVASLSASSLAFGSQAISVPSAAQNLKLTNSGTAALTGIAVSLAGTNSSDFSQTNTCGTSLAVAGSCSVAVVFTPSGVGSRSATVSIADNASGAPQTVALTGTGAPPFSLSAATTTATVKQGAAGSYALSFAAAAGTTTSSAASLTCTGLPSESSCVFSPASIPVGTSTQAVNLSITTTAPTAAILEPFPGKKGVAVVSCAMFAVWLLPWRRKTRWLGAAMALLLVLGVSGCNSTKPSSPSDPGTSTGTFTLTVTAQTSAYSATQSLTLMVTQ